MRRPAGGAAERVVVAVDEPDRGRVVALVGDVAPPVGWFKLGPVPLLRNGPALVEEVRGRGARVFLDLKFHDIPNTVSKAVREAAALGVGMLTVHALGGREMMARAAEAAREGARAAGVEVPLVLAVTVLTSHDEASLGEVGVGGGVEDEVLRLARLADEAGVDGLVASGRELTVLRSEFGDRFTLVVPGIRLEGPRHDQRRVVTPAEAARLGADYIVVGRTVTEASSPARAVRAVIASLEEGLAA